MPCHSDGPELLLTHSDTQDIRDPILGQQVGSLILQMLGCSLSHSDF